MTRMRVFKVLTQSSLPLIPWCCVKLNVLWRAFEQLLCWCIAMALNFFSYVFEKFLCKISYSRTLPPLRMERKCIFVIKT